MIDNPLSLERFRDSVAKGSFWPTGELFVRLIDAIIEDRARLTDTSATLRKTATGRLFNILEGAGVGAAGAAIERHSWRVNVLDEGGDPIEETGLAGTLNFTLDPGFLNTTQPGNMFATFAAEDDAWSIVRLEGQFDTATAALQTCSLDVVTHMPEDPAGSEDLAPPTSSRPLVALLAAGGRITRIVYAHRSSLDVRAVVTEVQCGANVKAYVWPDTFYDVLAEVANDE